MCKENHFHFNLPQRSSLKRSFRDGPALAIDQFLTPNTSSSSAVLFLSNWELFILWLGSHFCSTSPTDLRYIGVTYVQSLVRSKDWRSLDGSILVPAFDFVWVSSSSRLGVKTLTFNFLWTLSLSLDLWEETPKPSLIWKFWISIKFWTWS